MLPSPYEIADCPTCGNVIVKEDMLSGNDFGAKYFSDGKKVAPMSPEFPLISKCDNCLTYFWLNKLKYTFKVDWEEFHESQWADCKVADLLSLDDYLAILETDLITSIEEELTVRRLIWLAYNDRIRNGEAIFNSEADERHWELNVLRLIDLLEQTSSHEPLMLAELYRTNGDFESCIALLDSLHEFKSERLYMRIKHECELGNRWVVIL
jgi:hypothetical protein